LKSKNGCACHIGGLAVIRWDELLFCIEK